MRRHLVTAAALLAALAATAQDVPIEDYRPGDLVHPNWAYPHRFNVRMIEGGWNVAREAQLYSCSLEELTGRKGRCAALPRDRDLPYGLPVRIDGVDPPQLAEWMGMRDGWRVRDYALAKTTQGLARGRYVKRSPGQGLILSVEGVNSAQGDFMGLGLDLRDPMGAQAGGDEGFVPLMIYMRDRDMPATGTTIQSIRPGQDEFMAHLTSAPTHHDDQAAPRRLLVWTDGPRIPFRVSAEGHNPKPSPPLGGARWQLEAPLAFPDGQLPGSTRDVFALERTDWCATLDATRYQDQGAQYNYVLVSRFDSPRRFTTHRLAQGQNVGLYERDYVRGYVAVDHAVNAGHRAGHLLPCSIITGYDDARREFSVAPVIDTKLPAGSAYSIPSMGTMVSYGIKVIQDFRLGTSTRRTGVLVTTVPGEEVQAGDQAFVAAGHWREAFTAHDADAMLHDFHPARRADDYVFARLRGSSSWNGHEIEVWYPEPNGHGRARVEIPHVPGETGLVLVTRGKGAPKGKCVEPGLQRYYDLSSDEDYVCSSRLEWKRQ
jgi:hypothetical protein